MMLYFKFFLCIKSWGLVKVEIGNISVIVCIVDLVFGVFKKLVSIGVSISSIINSVSLDNIEIVYVVIILLLFRVFFWIIYCWVFFLDNVLKRKISIVVIVIMLKFWGVNKCVRISRLIIFMLCWNNWIIRISDVLLVIFFVKFKFLNFYLLNLNKVCNFMNYFCINMMVCCFVVFMINFWWFLMLGYLCNYLFLYF